MTFLIISNNEEEIRKEIHTLIVQQLAEETIQPLRLEELTHPDIHFLNGFDMETVGIADARAFTKILHKKPFKAKKHLGIILGFEKSTIEAQNALLKEFEDHPATVSYILGVIDENSILPTIHSRATVKYLKGKVPVKEHRELLKLLTFFIDDSEDLLIGFATVQKKEWTRLNAETFLSELYNKLTKNREAKSKLMALQKCSEYLRNNVSPKQVITYLLLSFRHKV